MISIHTSTLLCSSTLVLLTISLPGLLSYTVEDLEAKCEPCDPIDATKISHPTDCTAYFFCGYNGKWVYQICPSSTYFVEEEQVCVNPVAEKEQRCAYDLGYNDNINKDITLLPQCSADSTTSAVPTGATPDSNGTATSGFTGEKGGTTDAVVESTTTGAQKPNLTVVLAVLLAITFGLLIAVVLGILLYRRRQNQRRPKYFYTRKSPGADPVIHSNTAPPAGNAAYLSRSLLRSNQTKSVESVEYEVPLSEEPGYQEIPERSSKAYYSDPAEAFRPPRSLPVIAIQTSPDDIYSEAMTPDGEKTDDYMHPVSTKAPQDRHIYGAKSTDEPHYVDSELLTEDPYDYCQPEVANPTLSFKRGAEPPPATSPQSPDYYVDPIADIQPSNKSSHQYHTLEPLSRKD